ncbi:hypothetical protein CSB09_00860 [Candidatus Gracilibacteria bacterium]|nr:MAG: hypothetical protein CSB09_00860 [Candidatus Gracilibacteria bacterium]
MRTFLLSFCIGIFFLSIHTSFADPANCQVTGNMGTDISSVLQDCQGEGSIDISTGGSGVTSIKEYVKNIAKMVIQYGALFAVGALVASGIMYTVAYGDDTRMTTAKNIAIYALIGLVLLVIAFPLVGIIVDFIYGLGES